MLSKVEASLLASGFSKEDVVITPPHMIRKAIDKDTEIDVITKHTIF